MSQRTAFFSAANFWIHLTSASPFLHISRKSLHCRITTFRLSSWICQLLIVPNDSGPRSNHLFMMDTEERPAKIRKIQEPEQATTISRQPSTPSAEIITKPGQATSDDITDASSNKNSNAQGTEPPIEVPLSKNAKKRLARQQAWEEGRDARRLRRKEKQVARREQRRLQRTEAEAADGLHVEGNSSVQTQDRPQPVNIPITFLVDCGFDEQMTEKEIMSIAIQITRCYAENRRALYRPQMVVSSYGGRLQTRFETALKNPLVRWGNFHSDDGDFIEAAQKAKVRMLEIPAAGVERCEALALSNTLRPDEGEVVYLTADSDETLEELRPYTTYIIGGIVDRNRHKGICYKRAKDRGVKTAKLPIGEFMQMNSRAVLATNHVYEIMLRWLELKDWGKAFLKVIPKRKGGVLKNGVPGVPDVSRASDQELAEDDQNGHGEDHHDDEDSALHAGNENDSIDDRSD